MKRIPFTIVLLAAVLLGRTAAAQDDCKARKRDPMVLAFVPARIVVKPRFLFGSLKELIDHDFRTLPPGLTIEPLGPDGSVQIDSTKATTKQLREMFSDPTRFESVEEDVYIEAHGCRRVEPNDQFFGMADTRWWLDAIHAPEAWVRGHGNTDVVVAVVDSGIQADHSDLEGNVFTVMCPFHVTIAGRRIDCGVGDHGFDAVDGNCKAEPRTEHGTEVAGIIGARGDNCIGGTGVNWDVTVLPVTLLDNNAGCATRAIKALEFVRLFNRRNRRRVRVVNLSWGMGKRFKRLENELKLLAADDIVIVASAGNDAKDNDSTPVFPASYRSVPTIISVAATGRDLALIPSSNFGEDSVDIAAPGWRILTTSLSSSFDDISQTSAAAPFVSGGVALLASQCPGLSAIELRNMIIESADQLGKLECQVNGGRFLNLERASEACEAWKSRKSAQGTSH